MQDNTAPANDVKSEPETKPESSPELEQLKSQLEQSKENEKRLQRELSKANLRKDREEALRRELQDTRAEINDNFAAIADAVAQLGLADEAKAPLQRTVSASRQRQLIHEHMERKREEIGEDLEDAGIDWDADPRLADARKLWDNGKFDDAARAAHRVAMKAVKEVDKPKIDQSDPNIKAMIEAEVEKRMKEIRKMDTGSPSAPSAAKFDWAWWKKLPQSEKSLPENTKKMKEAIAKGELPE